jgi:hypothetical protein
VHWRCSQQAQLPHSRYGPQHHLFSVAAVVDSDFDFAAVGAVAIAAAVVAVGSSGAVVASEGASAASEAAAGFEFGLHFAAAHVGEEMAVVSCFAAAAAVDADVDAAALLP